MMGQQPRTESLFYYFRLEDQIPEDHLLRLIDRYVDLSFVRERLKSFYSSTGRPSIDPEVLLRLLLVGDLDGVTSERRLLEEVRMHLAYRWFVRLGLEQEIPDHSTFSKNRHGRFRQSGVFREVFEEIVRRCLEAGLVEGEHLAVDGTMVGANASQGSRVPREKLEEAAQVSRTVREYLAELEQVNPVSDVETISTTDPDAVWATKGGPAMMAYYDNYLIDTASRVILDVEATHALSRQEMVAARRMIDRVLGMVVGKRCPTSHSCHRSPSSDGWPLHTGPISLRPCGERLLLSGRKTTAVARPASYRAWFFLLFDSSSVPRVSTEGGLYANRLSQAFHSRGRTSSKSGAGLGGHTELQTLAESSL